MPVLPESATVAGGVLALRGLPPAAGGRVAASLDARLPFHYVSCATRKPA